MNRRQHARLARQLIEAAGGLIEAASACRVGKSQLAEYQSPHGEGFMPADVIADLEAHCGTPIYSRALFEARPEAGEARDLKEETCEAVEAAADLMRDVRLATIDGRLTATERDRLARVHARATAELAEVGEILARESLGREAG